jgi:hypothetical protein
MVEFDGEGFLFVVMEMEMVMLDLLELMVKPEGEDLGVLLEKEILE